MDTLAATADLSKEQNSLSNIEPPMDDNFENGSDFDKLTITEEVLLDDNAIDQCLFEKNHENKKSLNDCLENGKEISTSSASFQQVIQIY